MRQRLAGAVVLGLGLALLLAGAAMAVPRRSPHTRPVVGWVLLLVIVALLLSTHRDLARLHLVARRGLILADLPAGGRVSPDETRAR